MCLEGINVFYYGVVQVFNVLFDLILLGIVEDLLEGVELFFDKFESNIEWVIVFGVFLCLWELVLLLLECVIDLDDEILGEVVDFIYFG